MTIKDPYRFTEQKMPKGEKDIRIMQEELMENCELSHLEKIQNFPVFIDRMQMTRYILRYELFKKIIEIPGSIFECGVLFGGGLYSFAHYSAIFEPFNAQRRIVGFDTFEGLPEIHEKDYGKDQSSKLNKGAMGYDSQDFLMKASQIFDKNRPISHLPKIELVRGDLTKTMPKYFEENPHALVSLLYLDMDIYLGTKAAIETCVPRMPKGSIIAFDEFGCERWPGETVALLDTIGVKDRTLKRFPCHTYLSYVVL
jgi:hypothetical protein